MHAIPQLVVSTILLGGIYALMHAGLSTSPAFWRATQKPSVKASTN